MYVTITETRPDGTEITENVQCVSREDFLFDYERSQLPLIEVEEITASEFTDRLVRSFPASQ